MRLLQKRQVPSESPLTELYKNQFTTDCETNLAHENNLVVAMVDNFISEYGSLDGVYHGQQQPLIGWTSNTYIVVKLSKQQCSKSCSGHGELIHAENNFPQEYCIIQLSDNPSKQNIIAFNQCKVCIFRQLETDPSSNYRIFRVHDDDKNEFECSVLRCKTIGDILKINGFDKFVHYYEQ